MIESAYINGKKLDLLFNKNDEKLLQTEKNMQQDFENIKSNYKSTNDIPTDILKDNWFEVIALKGKKSTKRIIFKLIELYDEEWKIYEKWFTAFK